MKLAAALFPILVAGCITVPTGPLTDPQVLAARCAEANLALTVIQVSSKKVDPAKVEIARGVINTYCNSGGIVDYPTAINAIAAAIIQLRS